MFYFKFLSLFLLGVLGLFRYAYCLAQERGDTQANEKFSQASVKEVVPGGKTKF